MHPTLPPIISDEVRLLVANDPHFSDSTPQSRKDSYREAIIAKMEEVREIAKEYQVDAVLIPGDIFYHKNGARVTWSLLHRVDDLFKSYPCPVLAIAGNHDEFGDDPDSIFTQQPIGFLHRSGALKLLNGPPYALVSRQKADLGTEVVVGGRPFNRQQMGSLDYYDVPTPSNGGVRVCLAHIPLVPEATSTFGEHFCPSHFVHAGFDIMLAGHMHSGELGCVTSMGKYFVNVGAISRGTSHQYNKQRTVQASLISIIGRRENFKFTHNIIPLDSARPFEEVLSESKAVEQAEAVSYDAFINLLKGESEESSAENNSAIIARFLIEATTQPVADKVKEYLAKAEATVFG